MPAVQTADSPELVFQMFSITMLLIFTVESKLTCKLPSIGIFNITIGILVLIKHTILLKKFKINKEIMLK